MTTSHWLLGWRRLWAMDQFATSLRIFIALAAAFLACWGVGQVALIMPFFLGIIACALAETDDSWQGRLRAVLITLPCFALAAFSIQYFFDRPWLFAAAMMASTFALTMLGAISKRYQAIAYGTLVLAFYTAVATDQGGMRTAGGLPQPVLLLAGAAWYGLLSVAWMAIFRIQPLQQNLAQLYLELARYLELKAQLFEPVQGVDLAGRRLALANQNARVVEALNLAKESLISRLDPARSSRRVNVLLRQYFIAQDVHERASSTHAPYEELARAFFHSDMMYRCERVLQLQGAACRELAEAIRLHQPFTVGSQGRQAVLDMHAAVAYLRGLGRPEWGGLLAKIGALADNLDTLDQRLAHATTDDVPGLPAGVDASLLDRTPHTLGEAWERLRLELTPSAGRFRHAVRLSVALGVGYAVMHLMHAHQGYWILITTVFVSQPAGYGATRSRVVQRVIGTLVGLVAGWAAFRMFPSVVVQAMFAVVAGVGFFATRTTNYPFATASITVLVLLCLNQLGIGQSMIMPRLVDTLVGVAISVLAVLFILPDWRSRRFDQEAAAALAAHVQYLRETLAQYRSGQIDNLAYRVARRDAHNADASLATALTAARQEPDASRRGLDAALRFVVLSHTVLSYVSALGAHREKIPGGAAGPLWAASDHMIADLEHTARALQRGERLEPDDVAGHAQVEQVLEAAQSSPDEALRVIGGQLLLVSRLLPGLREQADALVALAHGDAPEPVPVPGAHP